MVCAAAAVFIPLASSAGVVWKYGKEGADPYSISGNVSELQDRDFNTTAQRLIKSWSVLFGQTQTVRIPFEYNGKNYSATVFVFTEPLKPTPASPQDHTAMLVFRLPGNTLLKMARMYRQPPDPADVQKEFGAELLRILPQALKGMGE